MGILGRYSIEELDKKLTALAREYEAESGGRKIIKAFKLFYNFNIPGAGYDSPLLSPKEVYALKPRPYIIMYQ
jgi:hypothetical protein